jgi:hypothetical protein
VRFVYGALTLCGGTFQNPSTTQQLCNSVEGLVPLLSGPTTPRRQRHQALPPARFRLFPFRSPLLRESLLLSFPRGTEMFQFPRFPLPALCVQAGVPPFFAVVGSPIRTSTDRRSVGSSPWLIAATHVLHRLQAPRHPPLALVAWRTRCSCSLCNSQGAGRRGRAAERDALPDPGRAVSPDNGTEVARRKPSRGQEARVPTTGKAPARTE